MTAMDVMYGIPHLLWTTSWQASVMAGAIWLTCRQWPRMPANLRVMLWWLVSLKFVIGLAWTQPIALPVLPASITPPATYVASVASVATATDAPSFVGNHSPIRSGSSSRNTASTSSISVVRSAAINAIVSYGLAAAAGLWLLGILLQGALLLRQLVRTRALVARSQPVEGDAAELFDDLVDRLDVRASRPRLRVSTDIATPQVTGLMRPVILLPVSALESFSTRELSLTLCHELMHVQRLDLWHGWIPSVAARLFFFHPLARFAAREYAIAREAACDARVLAVMDAPAYDYGRLLMRLGITAREATPSAAGASPTLQTLKRRLLMLHDASPHGRAFSPRWWALAAIAAVLVIPMRPTAQQRSEDNKPNEHNLHNVHNNHNEQHDESWVFVQDDENSAMHVSSMDLVEAKRLRGGASEPLIWFKRDGRAYVIRDRETLDNARALFIPQEEFNKKMRGLEDRQTILGARQTELRQTQEAMLEQVRTITEKVNEENAKLLKSVQSEVRASEDAVRRTVEEDLLRIAEAQRHDVRAHQEAISLQQRTLTEHQEALAAEQRALSRHLDEVGRALEREMRTLFDRALTNGIATPVK
jgi:bla regulator protein blaR1